MSWASSKRRAELPADWGKIRARVLKRAGYRCEHIRADTGERCTYAANQCDHKKRGLDHSEANLQALCEWHHKQKTSREAAAGRRGRPRATRKRPPSTNPGAL
ncbi:HNH endonuclease [Klebsiella pneumoniae]|nr:HNH endonuclease [Klebsiella pneumoniae]